MAVLMFWLLCGQRLEVDSLSGQEGFLHGPNEKRQ